MNNQTYTTEPTEFYAQRLLAAIRTYNKKSLKPVDAELIKKALHCLRTYQSTLPGEINQQIYVRPTKLAFMLTAYYLTSASLVAILLYDLAQKQHIEENQVANKFGRSIADKLTKLLTLPINTSTIAGLQHIDQAIVQGDRDILVIRLLDYLCRIEDVGLQSKYEQLELALQGIQTFVPLAGYMRLPVIETQLMDRCKLIIMPELLKDSSTTANPVIEIAGFKFQI